MSKAISLSRNPLIVTLLTFFVLICGCNSKQMAPESTELPEELAKAQSFLDNGSAKKAVSVSDDWLKDNPVSDHLELGLKINADAYFADGDFYKAYLSYEKILNQFGATKYFEYAIKKEIEIAKKFLAGKTRKVWKVFRLTARLEGLKILDDIEVRWPGSESGAEAVMLRADHFFERGKYFEAEQEYHRMLVSYNKSCHYPRAMFQEAESKLRQYEGKYYDSICLDEASVLFRQFKLRYPEKAKEKKVDAKLAWILQEEVEKEFEIADFYNRTGKKDQAVIYWKNVIEMAPENELAQRAAQNVLNAQAAE